MEAKPPMGAAIVRAILCDNAPAGGVAGGLIWQPPLRRLKMHFGQRGPVPAENGIIRLEIRIRSPASLPGLLFKS
jgi:hypothetical protein